MIWKNGTLNKTIVRNKITKDASKPAKRFYNDYKFCYCIRIEFQRKLENYFKYV